jgi:N-methylhydantoinase B
MPVTAGLMYRDSVEIDEQKYPIRVEEQRPLTDTEGAGRRRGAPGSIVIFGPTGSSIVAAFFTAGYGTPPRGVRGGAASRRAAARKRERDGTLTELPPVSQASLAAGEALVSISSGGGGYGPPREREPERVLGDVREGFVSRERAAATYGVVVRAPSANREAEIDWPRTHQLRNTTQQAMP